MKKGQIFFLTIMILIGLFILPILVKGVTKLLNWFLGIDHFIIKYAIILLLAFFIACAVEFILNNYKLITRLFSRKIKEKNVSKVNLSILAERPIIELETNKFPSVKRLVERVNNAINSWYAAPSNIAILGEKGAGKTSAINLIISSFKNNDNYIVFEFEPLLEAKFNCVDLTTLFFMRLQNEISDKNVKELIIHVLKNLRLHVDFKLIGVGFDLERSLSDIKDSKKIVQLCDAINSINFNKKIIIFFDEIDRLPAKAILEFLLFSRIIEKLNNVICLIGIDYFSSVKKIQKEYGLSIPVVVSEIDKFIQLRYDVSSYIDVEEIGKYALDLFNESTINQGIDWHVDDGLKDNILTIAKYLKYPRAIKKWVLTVIDNWMYIAHSENFHLWLRFLAVISKYPHVLTRFVQYQAKEYFYLYEIDEAIKCGHNTCRLAELGICFDGQDDSQLNKDPIKKCRENKLEKDDLIREGFASKAIIDWLNNVENYEKFVYIMHASQKEADQLSKFIKGNANQVIQALISRNAEPDINLLFQSIAKFVTAGNIKNRLDLDINLLNALWNLDHGAEVKGSWYYQLYPRPLSVLFLAFLPIENVINNANIFLSCQYLIKLCALLDVKLSMLSLENFRNLDNSKLSRETWQHFSYQGKSLANITVNEFLEIIDRWIKKFELDLHNSPKSIFGAIGSVSLLYNSIYFYLLGKKKDDLQSLYEQRKKFLTKMVIEFLKDNHKQDYKLNFVNDLLRFCNYSAHPQAGDMYRNPLAQIFWVANQEFINEIRSFINNNQLDYLSEFETCLEWAKKEMSELQKPHSPPLGGLQYDIIGRAL